MKKRHKHNLGYYRLCTADMGQLVPVGLTEVLPGDTFQHSTSAVIRLSPMAAPVMHPISVRIHHFFVPHRLVWSGWENFITGGPDGNDASTIPTMTITDGVPNVHDYFGINPIEGLEVSRLPRDGYFKIWDEYFRDQDLQQESGSNTQTLRTISWEKDYFTSSRPWEQKGDAVTIPLGDTAPCVGSGPFTLSDNAGETSLVRRDIGNQDALFVGSNIDQNNNLWFESGISADLSNAEAVNVNEFRRAFALQRYQEARARYGSRYTEYLRYLGIKPSDARLQRPEYLGGGKVNVSVSEVLQTAPETDNTTPGQTEYGVGDMYGHGIAAVRSNAYRKFFEEHGYIHTLLSVRPRAMYTNGVPRTFLKKDREDFFQKELAYIGQQPVFNNEVYADLSNTNDDIFGYQDRYDEYRGHTSSVSGEFRNLLNYWHLGRNFDSQPVLNASFVNCIPSKRIFNEQTQNSLWIMAQHRQVARRLVNKRASNRII